jgi:hypothetical protein
MIQIQSVKSILMRPVQLILLIAFASFGTTAFGCVSTWADTSSDGTYVYGTATLEDDSTGSTLGVTVYLTDPTNSYQNWSYSSGIEEVSASTSLTIGTDYGTYNVEGDFDDPGNSPSPAYANLYVNTSHTTYSYSGSYLGFCNWDVDCPAGTTNSCNGYGAITASGGCPNYLVVPYVYFYKSGIRYCNPISIGFVGQPQETCT